MSVQAFVQSSVEEAFQLAGDLVTEFIYTAVGASTYSTTTSAMTEATATGTFKGVIVEYKDFERGGLIEAGDRKILVEAAGLPFTPKAGDSVTFNNESWKIESPGPIYAGDTVVLYQMQIRR